MRRSGRVGGRTYPRASGRVGGLPQGEVSEGIGRVWDLP